MSRLRDDITTAEGYKLQAYKDTLGFWTAGVGHLLDQTKDWTGHIFDIATVNQWLIDDLLTAESAAKTLLEWTALDTDARQNAVVELVFNMGLQHWKQFAHCRMYMTKKDWNNAATELVRSLWARQVGARRAGRLANYIRTGEFD